jgi:hypothetical protein
VKYCSFHKATLMLLVIAPLLFSCAANDARKYTLAIYGPVHIYASSTPPAEYPGTDFIAIVGTRDRVEVLQVIQKRHHVAVKIRLNDGREGWVFSGENIELRQRSISQMNRLTQDSDAVGLLSRP